MNNHDFLLDILEDQKQRKRNIDFVREEMTDNLAQQLIDELRNMTELEDEDEDKEEEEEEEEEENENQTRRKVPSHPDLSTTTTTVTQDQIDRHLDPKLQSENQKKGEKSPTLKRKTNHQSVKRSKSNSTQPKTAVANPRKGKKPNLNRDHLGANHRLMKDFFQISQHSSLDQQDDLNSNFYNKFLLSKKLFLKIVNDLTKNDLHFTQRKDALGNLGHSSYQKVLVAFRQLTHGIGNEKVIMDEYIRMADSTALESLIRFCHNIDELYGREYLRSPNETDLRRIEENNRIRRIPGGYIGSLSFKYWQWDHRPTGWSGRFKTCSLPTVVLEALASSDSWIWYAFFSTPGNCRDIDVFHPNPPIYSSQFQAPQFPTQPESSSQTITGYYHAHPIYPPIGPIVSSIDSKSQNDQTSGFNPLSNEEFQSICRRDFERAMDKLESRFQIIKLPCRLWSSNSMKLVIKTAMILHNMIVEDEQQSSKPSHLSPSPSLPPALPQNHHDIQVNPSLLLPVHDPPHDTPNLLPPHVLQKLDDRFKYFNPNLSLRL